MSDKIIKSLDILWIPVAAVLLLFAFAFNIYTGLDQGEAAKKSDIIIVAEGMTPNRAYQGVDLLQNGYSESDKLVVSPGTGWNLPFYFKAGANKEQLIIEEEATSTWTNATNTIEIMEQNGWDSAIVVTTDFHIRRTRLSYERAASGKDITFTYVSSYADREGKPVSYLSSSNGRYIGRRETAKFFGYLLGLYHFIDLD